MQFDSKIGYNTPIIHRLDCSIVLIAYGLNHTTAPLPVREKIALDAEKRDALLRTLLNTASVNEAVLLSTCNRTELYCETDSPNQLINALAENHPLSFSDTKPYCYRYDEADAIRHMLRVASGLDSMMLGEPQILGQMKEAYQHACRLGGVYHQLKQLFPFIFRASKRIRTESGIGKNPTSVAYAAAQLIGQLFSDMAQLSVFIIGSGDTAARVADYLKQQGVTQFLVASRTREHAEHLADSFLGKTVAIQDIAYHLAKADVVISATACPLPFISKRMVKNAMDERQQAPMFFLDLAVPRDIEPDVSDITDVHLYNLDHLQHLAQRGMEQRRTAAILAEQFIEQALQLYQQQHRSLRAKHLICNYRARMQQLAQAELDRALQRMTAGHCQQAVLMEFSERLVNKLTHTPTVGLRRAANDSRDELLDLAHYLFDVTRGELTPS